MGKWYLLPLVSKAATLAYPFSWRKYKGCVFSFLFLLYFFLHNYKLCGFTAIAYIFSYNNRTYSSLLSYALLL